MKSMNQDAKVLIRSYVDSIEEYLKSTCKMHPNEIDTLLNEINDFMYIRSNELATGNTITHSNVLQAMEECGSPSEICDQYYESDSEEFVPTPKSQSTFTPKQKKSGMDKARLAGKKFPSSSDTFFGQLRKFKVFALYRVIFGMFFLPAILMAIFSPFGNPYQTNFSYEDVLDLINSYLAVTYVWIVMFFILEGWIIPKWKNRLSSRGFRRSLDDGVINTISRVGFFGLFFKASLLPIPWIAYVIFPSLIVIQILMERQLKSNLWNHTLSPALITIAKSIEENTVYSHFKREFNGRILSIQQLTTKQKVALVFGGISLFFSFFYPWGYGWDGNLFTTYYSTFETHYLVVYLATHLFLASIVLIAFIITSFSSEAKQAHSVLRLDSTSFWIGRMIGIRSLLMIFAFDYGYLYSFEVFLTLFFFIIYGFYEATVGFQRHQALKKSLVASLQSFGQSSLHVSNYRPALEPRKSSSPSRAINATESLSEVPREIKSTSMVSPQIQDSQTPPPSSPSESGIVTISRGLYSFLVQLTSLLVTLLTPVYSFLKAIGIALFLFLSMIYESVLLILTILTSTTLDGSYVIPVFSFSAVNDSYSLYRIGGFTIWSWYLLGLLVVQVFIIVVIQWFQFLRKHPEGFITIVFRNFSRILLIIMFLGALYQVLVGDSYAILRIISLLILTLYLELSCLKIRLERRTWNRSSSNETNETITRDQNSTNTNERSIPGET